MIPDFDDNGNLPPGIHVVSWEEFSNLFGKTVHRRRLLQGLKAALDVLAIAGCRTVYIGGSFVTSKQVPNDFDACWDTEAVDFDLLYSAEPLLFDFTAGRKAQKIKYLGEFFPASSRNSDTGRTFLDFFQIDKETGDPKGIIALDLRRK